MTKNPSTAGRNKLFGVGGVNAHIVLEEYPIVLKEYPISQPNQSEQNKPKTIWPGQDSLLQDSLLQDSLLQGKPIQNPHPQIIVLSAKNEERLKIYAEQVRVI